MNSKITMSALSIVSALALMGGTAFAAFVSTATATGNTFSTGNADLEIAKNNIPAEYSNSMTGFTGLDLAPGVAQNFQFYLRNDSASAITLANIVKLTSPTDSGALNDELQVSFSCTNGGGGGTTTNTGSFTVNQWVAGNASVGSLAQNDIAVCQMSVMLPAGSTMAGADSTFNIQFDATQAP